VNAEEFIQQLTEGLSTLVLDERAVRADFSPGFSPGPGRGSVVVNFFNLPASRVKERRGGGAEAENNRQLFFVYGFNAGYTEHVDRLSVEQGVNGIYDMRGRAAPRMRKKTAFPEKVAKYLADYINEVASEFPPNFTHE